MFGRGVKLFRLFGFTVRMDASWLVIAVLVTWSLAAGVFPASLKRLPEWMYWAMGGGGAIGLFASIIFHEYAHSLVARRFGLSMNGITLFLFGGVAEMSDEPPSPRAEFWIAIAGPVSSAVLAAVFLGASVAGKLVGGPEMLVGVTAYLAWTNVVLVIFNMIPAFPLDGGRVLRSALWGWRKDLRRATRVTSLLGGWFGMGLIGLGIGSFVFGNVLGGMWWFLVGLFVRQAAHRSYRQLVYRQALQGEPVSRFMQTEPVTVPACTSIQDLVENYICRYHHKLFPVVDDGELRGCVALDKVKGLARQEWPAHTVAELTDRCTESNTIPPDTDAVKALAKMRRGNLNRLLVVENGSRLLGIVSLQDLSRFLALKIELENGHRDPSLAGMSR